MKPKLKLLLHISFILLILQCGTYIPQESNTKTNDPLTEFGTPPFPIEDGSCYAKCRNNNGDYTDWIKVLCDTDITPNFIEKLKIALIQKGFYLAEGDLSFNDEMKKALTTFQEKNDLPVGQLNIETLKRLGFDL